ncbi:cleavage stimulating factor 64-like [Phoenix dactylifera]|uniref:Cleavage stimulating factor 64-like n=1 Tax=Phoenix dactylifera TaxID=42345 RepID=A0A8B7CEV3_PHODC|nr:cleavage stimulating factor 64-like [Phoenix dactylifera]
MAAKQPPSGDGLASQMAGMSKSQLYEIMRQMKILIDQNQQQAKRILIENPLLTRALFQAQIMLGMVQPPQVMPTIQQALSQPQSAQVVQQPNVQTAQSLPVQAGMQGQASLPQSSVSVKQQHPTQPSIALPSASVPPLNFQSQTMQSNPPHSAQQTKSFLNTQAPLSLPQSSQIHNLTLPPPAPPHYSILPSHMPIVSGQTQQPLQTAGLFNQPLQPPWPQQPRPPSMQPLSHQLHSQMPHALGFQPSSAHQQLLSHPMFHSGSNPPSSFSQGQPPLPSQPPPQQLYQGGPHIGQDYSNQAGTSIQAERGAAWAPSLPEKAASGAQLPGPVPLVSGQTASGAGGQPPCPPPLTPEMEKALLQQVMSLTPEQINLLPPEQRHQVLQLQEMLRQ